MDILQVPRRPTKRQDSDGVEDPGYPGDREKQERRQANDPVFTPIPIWRRELLISCRRLDQPSFNDLLLVCELIN